MLVWRAFSLHQNDGKMDGERLENQVVTMDKGRKEKLEMEEPVLVPKIVHITRQVLSGLGLGQGVQAGCRCTATARHAPTEYVRGGLLHAISHRRRDDFSRRCHTWK